MRKVDCRIEHHRIITYIFSRNVPRILYDSETLKMLGPHPLTDLVYQFQSR